MFTKIKDDFILITTKLINDYGFLISLPPYNNFIKIHHLDIIRLQRKTDDGLNYMLDTMNCLKS